RHYGNVPTHSTFAFAERRNSLAPGQRRTTCKQTRHPASSAVISLGHTLMLRCFAQYYGPNSDSGNAEWKHHRQKLKKKTFESTEIFTGLVPVQQKRK